MVPSGQVSMTEHRVQPRFSLSKRWVGRFSTFQHFLIEDFGLEGLRVRSNYSAPCGSRCRVFLNCRGNWKEFEVEVVRVQLTGFCDREDEVFRPGPLYSIALHFLALDGPCRDHLIHLVEDDYSSFPEGEGLTSFTLVHPVMIPERALAEKKKILIADDEECIRDMLTELLQGQGFEVIQAEDGEVACQQFATHQKEIRLVTLDIDMPRLDGYQAYRRIRQLDPEVRILFISGAIRFPRQQIDDADWMDKPFPIDSLLHYVGHVGERIH